MVQDRYICNGRTLVSRIWSIKRYHFQRPRTPNLKVTPLFDA